MEQCARIIRYMLFRKPYKLRCQICTVLKEPSTREVYKLATAYEVRRSAVSRAGLWCVAANKLGCRAKEMGCWGNGSPFF